MDEFIWKYCFPHMQGLLLYAVRSAYFRREEFYAWLKPASDDQDPRADVTAYLCDKDYQFLLRCARRLKLNVGKSRGMGIIAYKCVLFALGEKNESG